jgi:hypothetical protein
MPSVVSPLAPWPVLGRRRSRIGCGPLHIDFQLADGRAENGFDESDGLGG